MIAAAWVAVAPHEAATHAVWRFYEAAGSATAAMEGPLNALAKRLPVAAAIHVVVPLTRCIVMAVDLPPLQGAKLQQALAGVLGDRLTGTGGAQHFAAGPAENGRIRTAATCDAVWLKQCLTDIAACGLRVARVVPEAALLPKAAAWWGQLQTDHEAAWLMRTTDGEAMRAAPALLDAMLPPRDDPAHSAWQWFADPACPTPPAPHTATAIPTQTRAMSAAALLRGAAKTAWDLQQFAFTPPGGALRLMAWLGNLTQQRSGRFALGALLALIVINGLGLNLYAMKQQRAIRERHAEMERIVTQALPGVPRLLEPAVQLEAAWRRTRGDDAPSGTGALLGWFAKMGSAQAVTAIDASEFTLRAAYIDNAALERSWAVCQSAALREPMDRAGVRCTRDGERLLLEFARPAAAPTKG